MEIFHLRFVMDVDESRRRQNELHEKLGKTPFIFQNKTNKKLDVLLAVETLNQRMKKKGIRNMQALMQHPKLSERDKEKFGTAKIISIVNIARWLGKIASQSGDEKKNNSKARGNF